MNVKNLKQMKGGVSMDTVLAVLKEMDRMENNLYFPTEDFVAKSLDTYGYLTFMMFVCPKMQSKYLGTSDPEKFMPIEEPKDGLFFPRVPKLQQLISKLWAYGVPSKLIFVIGDNDFDVYKGPPMGIFLDKDKTDIRRKLYLNNLSLQISKVFPQLTEVLSLGLMKVEQFKGNIEIPQDMIEREVSFQEWSFNKYYEGKVPSKQILSEMSELKIRAYAEQGFLIESAEAVLINTEGTTVEDWVLRTKMFQVGGAKFFSIYPYVRQELLTKKES